MTLKEFLDLEYATEADLAKFKTPRYSENKNKPYDKTIVKVYDEYDADEFMQVQFKLKRNDQILLNELIMALETPRNTLIRQLIREKHEELKKNGVIK
jgi:flagellar basal body-associated protein FliL